MNVDGALSALLTRLAGCLVPMNGQQERSTVKNPTAHQHPTGTSVRFRYLLLAWVGNMGLLPLHSRSACMLHVQSNAHAWGMGSTGSIITIACINYAASCSGNVQVTSTSLNLSISVSNCDLGTFSINMIPSRWCCPRKYFDNLQWSAQWHKQM